MKRSFQSVNAVGQPKGKRKTTDNQKNFQTPEQSKQDASIFVPMHDSFNDMCGVHSYYSE